MEFSGFDLNSYTIQLGISIISLHMEFSGFDINSYTIQLDYIKE